MLTLFTPVAITDAATTAWIAAVVAAGGSVSGTPTTGRQKLVDDLIKGLKTDGVWAKLDRLYVFAAENTQSALIDLVALAQGAPASSPTFAVDVGYTVNGTSLVGLNYNPTTDAVHFSRDDCHYGAWNLATGTSTGELLADVPVTSLMLYPKYSNGQIYTRLQDSWNGLAIGDPTGWLAANRTSSADRDTYQNGSLFGNVFTGGSTVVHNAPTILSSGGPCCAVSFGGSLTSTNHTALYNRLRTYMTAVGVP
jgi:hypothetical protein